MLKIGLSLFTLLFITTVHAENAKGLWTTSQGSPAHTGYVNTSVNHDNFKILWKKTFSQPDDIANWMGQPVITDHLVYFTYADINIRDHNQLIALNPRTGEQVWQVIISDAAYISDPAYGDDKIYVTVSKPDKSKQHLDYLQAYNADNGALIFSTLIPGLNREFISPVVASHHVFISTPGKQWSVNGKTGAIEWEQPSHSFYTEAAAFENSIARTTDEGIEIFDQKTGNLTASIKSITGEYMHQLYPPIYDASTRTLYSTVYAEADNPGYPSPNLIGTLTAYDIDKKSVKWRFRYAPAYFGQPVLSDRRVMHIPGHDMRYELDTSNGVVISTDRRNNYPMTIMTGNGYLIMSTIMEHGNDAKTIAYHSYNNKTAWTIPTGGKIAMGNGILYIVDQNQPTVGQKTVTAVEVDGS